MTAPTDDRLDLLDQGSFLGLRALGHQPNFQATWTYRRPVDLDALRRFADGLADTLLGRLVERSPLPGGRHRWASIDHTPAVEVEAAPRPAAEALAWTDEFGERRTDPETGPGWRIGVLPLTDGGTAVTMIVPHTLGDGLCVLQAIADAVEGRRRRPDYPRRGVRRRGRVLWSDLVAFVAALPSVVRAVVAGVRVARAQARSAPRRRPVPVRVAAGSGSGSNSGSAAAGEDGAGAPFRVPVACVRVDLVAWDAAAHRLGGTSNTLVSAVAARLGRRLGRIDDEGTVTLAVPVSVRVEGDTRANALDAATVRIRPDGLTEDLRPLRAATKDALVATAEQAHELRAVLPLIPLTPPAAARKAETVALGAAALPVGCSNYGDLPIAVPRIDGADADDLWVRLNEPGTVPADLDRIGGQLYVLSGRALDTVFLSTVARPVGGGLDRDQLHAHVAAVLAEFGLAPSVVTR